MTKSLIREVASDNVAARNFELEGKGLPAVVLAAENPQNVAGGEALYDVILIWHLSFARASPPLEPTVLSTPASGVCSSETTCPSFSMPGFVDAFFVKSVSVHSLRVPLISEAIEA